MTTPRRKGCESDEALLRFARGESNAAETEQINRHIDHCLSCAEFVAVHDETEDVIVAVPVSRKRCRFDWV